MDQSLLQMIIRARDEASGTIRSVNAALGTHVGRLEQVQRAADLASRSGAMMQRTGMGIGAGGAAIGGVIAAATREAVGFGRELYNWQSLARVAEPAIRRTGDAMLDMLQDPQVIGNAKLLGAGLYDIQSSGYTGAVGLQALEISSKGAAAGLTETAVAADVLTSVGNAYGARTGPQLQRMMDVMFRTVDRGKVTFAELAQQIGPAAAAASQAGVSFEELNAAYATMTIQGIDAAESATSLERLIVQFLDPPKELAKNLKEMGYSSGLAALRANGLAGSVKLLYEAAGRDPAALAQLGFSMRSLRGMFALTGESADTYRQNLGLMANASGATAAALREQAKSTDFQWQHTKAALSGVAVEFAQNIEPALQGAMAGANQILGWMHDLPDGSKKLIAWGGALSAAALMGTGGLLVLGGAMRRWRADIALIRVSQEMLRREQQKSAATTVEQVAADRSATRSIETETAAINTQTAALMRNMRAADERLALQLAAGSKRNLRLLERTPVMGGSEPGWVGLYAGAAADRRAWQNYTPGAARTRDIMRQGFLLSAGGRAAGGAARGMGMAGVADIAGMGMMMFGGPGVAEAGMGVSMLAPYVSSIAAALPVILPAAVAAAGIFMLHQHTVGQALKDLEARKGSEREAVFGMADEYAFMRGGERIDMAAAQGYQPTKQVERALSVALREPGRREAILRNIRGQEGGAAYEWMRAQMPDVTHRKLTLEERLNETRPERYKAMVEQEREAEFQRASAAETLHRTTMEQQREAEYQEWAAAEKLKWMTPPDAQQGWVGAGGAAGQWGTTVQQNFYVNDQARVGAIAGRAAQAEIDRALPAY